MVEDVTVTPSEAIEAIDYAIDRHRPVCLWGTYGVGKSQIWRQVAERRSMRFFDLRLALMEGPDLAGLYQVVDGKTVRRPPDFWPQDKVPTLILFDELNRAPTLVQNAALQPALDHMVADLKLPQETYIGAACNREGDGGGVQRMPAALSSRFLNLNVEPDLDSFSTWANSVGLHPMVLAFLRFRPNLLCVPDTKARNSPNPRGWEFVAQLASDQPGENIELALVAGAVGKGAAVEYLSFARMFRALPNLDALLLDPANAVVPTEVGTLYAVASALGARANLQNWARVLTYLDRLPPEYGVFAVKDAVTRSAALATTPEFTRWAVAHQEVL